MDLIKVNDLVRLYLLYTLQGPSCVQVIAMTAAFQPSVESCHHVSAESWTINGSSLKPGLFPFTLDVLLEGCKCRSSTFTQTFAQCRN